MDKRAYWIWLSAALGAGAVVDEIVSAYPDALSLYEAGEFDWRISGVFSPRQIQKLAELNPLRAQKNVEICEKNGWSFVTPEDEEYPQLLLKTKNFPLVLYVWGDISYINSSVPVGVVGTRRPSPGSVTLTRSICAAAAQAGAVIISGGALGIDSASHEGAILGGGKTVAVMGCGLGSNYLMTNEGLRRDISRHGAVVSEYSPFSGVTQASFPMRNRIISGMSLGTLVIEAGEKSGSLITAARASEQGRDVFAVPGDVISGSYTGANKLIRDGARPVSNATELLEEYSILFPGRLDLSKIPQHIKAEKPSAQPKPTPKPKPVPRPSAAVPEGLSQAAMQLYSLFKGEPMHADDISAESGLTPGEVISALTELEIEGLVAQESGKMYNLI